MRSIKICSLQFSVCQPTLTLSGTRPLGSLSCNVTRACLNILIDSIQPWSGGALWLPGISPPTWPGPPPSVVLPATSLLVSILTPRLFFSTSFEVRFSTCVFKSASKDSHLFSVSKPCVAQCQIRNFDSSRSNGLHRCFSASSIKDRQILLTGDQWMFTAFRVFSESLKRRGMPSSLAHPFSTV